MNPSLLRIAHVCYRALPVRPLRQLAYRTFASMVRNRRVVRTIDDVRFDLDLGEMIDLSIYLRQYEPEVRAAIARETAAGMTVLDIGANIGAHALVFAKLVGPSGRVIAFEPTDYAFAKLRRNASLNPELRVEPVKIALSDHTGAEQRVNFRSSWRTDGGRADGESTVAFETLDRWCAAHAVDRVDLVKIDVDGNEYPLMVGARTMIERHRPVMLMEAVGLHFDDPQRNPFAILRGLGYRFRELKTGEELTVEQMAERLPRNDPGITTSFNVLATARDRA